MAPEDEPPTPPPSRKGIAGWLGSNANNWEGHRSGPIPESVGWSVTSYLISGPAMFGAIGYLLDQWLGLSFLLVVGILGGMALSLYLIWVRYGTQ